MIDVALGIAVGIIMALTGAGGGILAVPLLVFAAQLSFKEAAPVGLLAVGMAAAMGAILGLQAGIVRYRAAMLMATAGVLFAPIGVWIAGRTDGAWLNGLFALVLLFVAFRTYRQASNDQANATPSVLRELPCIVSADNGRFVWTTRCARALVSSGLVAGLMSGLLGVGGGFVMVPAMARYTDLSMQSIVATSLAVIALVSLSGVAANAYAATLDWSIALPFAGGALAGMLAGRFASSRVSGSHLQKGFAVVSAAVAIGMTVKSFA